ncbi:MAG: LptF/LptG family permease [Desulfovibrionales bacterium]|nr:LptF/LptG family permease [Desulfovibrionales bacterium]
MSLLTRYMFKQNFFLMALILGVGTAVYLLADLFERLDDFLDAGVGAATILMYFLCKLPLIISQILPAVFLLACTIQLCVMSRNKELVALQAGGISFNFLVRFIIVVGLGWAVVQLGFSQYLGVLGDVESKRIWTEDVRGRQADTNVLENVWFRHGEYVLHLEQAMPNDNLAKNVTVMRLSADSDSILEVLKAKTAMVERDDWTLYSVIRTIPGSYEVSSLAQLTLPIQQQLDVFKATSSETDLNKLSIWQLGESIDRLAAAGSNVESLRTIYHQKLAYAAAVVIMGLVAVMLLTWGDSLYVNISVGLVLTFAFYAMFTWSGALGERGSVNPIVGAWLPDVLFGMVTLGRVFWYTRSRVKKTASMTLSGGAPA